MTFFFDDIGRSNGPFSFVFFTGFDEKRDDNPLRISSDASLSSFTFTQNDFSLILNGMIAFQLARFIGPSTSHFFFGLRPCGSCSGIFGAGGAKPPIGGRGGPIMPGIGGGGGPIPKSKVGELENMTAKLLLQLSPGIGGGGGAPIPGIGGGRGAPKND